MMVMCLTTSLANSGHMEIPKEQLYDDYNYNKWTTVGNSCKTM